MRVVNGWRGRAVTPLFLISVALLPGARPLAASDTSGVVVESGCDVIQAAVTVPEERVRPLVPQEFTLDVVAGQATVVVTPVHCDSVAVPGAIEAEMSWVSLRVGLKQPPDGEPVLNEFYYYQLFLAADNWNFIRYFRRAGGLSGEQAVYVKRLSYRREGGLGGSTVRVEAPAPTPSPFSLEASVLPTEGFADLTVGIWSVTRDGEKWAFLYPDRLFDLGLAPGSGRIILHDDDSLLAQIFCHPADGVVEFGDASTHVTFSRGEYRVAVQHGETSATGEPTC